MTRRNRSRKKKPAMSDWLKGYLIGLTISTTIIMAAAYGVANIWDYAVRCW